MHLHASLCCSPDAVAATAAVPLSLLQLRRAWLLQDTTSVTQRQRNARLTVLTPSRLSTIEAWMHLSSSQAGTCQTDSNTGAAEVATQYKSAVRSPDAENQLQAVSNMTVNARCECGKCEFRVDGKPSEVFRCHCKVFCLFGQLDQLVCAPHACHLPRWDGARLTEFVPHARIAGRLGGEEYLHIAIIPAEQASTPCP